MAEEMKEVEKRQGRQLISILVPCYNEEAVLREFYRRTAAVIDGIPQYDFQFMFVNDGSKDGTLSIMRELHEKDERVSYVNLSRNFGKEIAMTAGIDYLTGDAAIIMDADLQDPPELIPEMISWWEQGLSGRQCQTAQPCRGNLFQEMVVPCFLHDSPETL